MSLFSRKPSAAAALSGRSIEDDERRTSRYLIRTMALVLAVAFALSACSLAPKYERPDSPVPAQFPLAQQGQKRDQVAKAVRRPTCTVKQ